jgi:RimJ/RimL family protein N-acetyltransferase
MPQREPAVRFEPMMMDHLPMMRAWLERPHVREWWGDPDTELAGIVEMIKGRDLTRPFIFHVDEKPMGYIQYWFIGPHQKDEWTKDNPWLKELPSDAVGVDLTIGEADMLSRGIGSAVLRAFVNKLRDEGHRVIIIDPDPKNARAVRAYEKAGFTPIPRLLGRTADVLIMQHRLNASGTIQ